MEDYRSHLKTRARPVPLHRCGATVPGVLTIYDYEYYSKLMLSDLVAVPAGKSRSMEADRLDVVPGMSGERKHWTDVTSCELQRKTSKESHRVFPFVNTCRKGSSMYPCVLSPGVYWWLDIIGIYLDSSTSYGTLDIGNIGNYVHLASVRTCKENSVDTGFFVRMLAGFFSICCCNLVLSHATTLWGNFLGLAGYAQLFYIMV